MERKIGAKLARTFREITQKSNETARAEFSIVSLEEMKEIESLLKKIDNSNFDLKKELYKYFDIEG